ncbi:MAG: alpha-glucosidase C-terminal domain-containing protein, partial [Myxococcota bacterium]
QTRLLARSLTRRHQLPSGCVWANYLRSHDDIGWTFDDQDAAELGINAFDHRRFLNEFYTGQFPGSFARGVPFQYNPDTQDMRISGTMASLAGLEQAIERRDDHLIEIAVRRILLLYGVILSVGGLPLLYLGEEWAVLNNYDYVKDPAKAGDSRWIHRPKKSWDYLADQTDLGAIQQRIYDSIATMIQLRKAEPAFRGIETEVFPTENDSVLGYMRADGGHRVLVLANFSDSSRTVEGNILRTVGVGRFFDDQVTGRQYATVESVKLEPYACMWLKRA